MRQSVGRGGKVVQSPAGCLLNPFAAVTVAVEDYILVFDDGAADKVLKSVGKVGRVLKLVIKAVKLVCYDGVEHCGRHGDRLA